MLETSQEPTAGGWNGPDLVDLQHAGAVVGAYVIQFAPLCHLLETLSPLFRGRLCCPLVCKLAVRVARVSRVGKVRSSLSFANFVGKCTKLAK